MIIDAHVHAGHADALTDSWETFGDIEVSLRRMDQVGIDKAVVLPIGSANFQHYNRELARIVQAHADRLFGFAKVNQTADAGRIEAMLAEAFDKLPLLGLKLHGHPNREIMEVMDHYRKPILVDPRGEVYGLRYPAESFPQVPIIIAHMGKFCCIDTRVRVVTMWLARRYANVYFDTSSVMDHESLELAVAEGLSAKMIFGSDSPGLHCGVELARIHHLDLTDEQREMVLWRNIARLIGIET